jgi:hypothetical protein
MTIKYCSTCHKEAFTEGSFSYCPTHTQVISDKAFKRMSFYFAKSVRNRQEYAQKMV